MDRLLLLLLLTQRSCHSLHLKTNFSVALVTNVLLPEMFHQPTASAIKGAIQLGIGYAVGNLSSKPDRDVLMQDFSVVESIFLPK